MMNKEEQKVMPPIKKLAIQFGEPTYNYLIFNKEGISALS